jgi:hypothetical protein
MSTEAKETEVGSSSQVAGSLYPVAHCLWACEQEGEGS